MNLYRLTFHLRGYRHLVVVRVRAESARAAVSIAINYAHLAFRGRWDGDVPMVELKRWAA